MLFAQLGLLTRPALVNGVAGAVTTRDGVAVSVGAFTVRAGRSWPSTSWPTPTACARST